MVAVTKLEPKGRLSAADWEQAALDYRWPKAGLARWRWNRWRVSSASPRAVSTGISRPARRLIKAALERWERRDEDEIMAQVEPIADPRARLRELFRASAARCKSHVIYAALMQCAGSSAGAAGDDAGFAATHSTFSRSPIARPASIGVLQRTARGWPIPPT